MVRSSGDELQDTIRVLLKQFPKGLSIEEVANQLSISRTTTTKYLNAMEQTGQVEARPCGPAKVFSLTERIPIEDILSLLPHLILVFDETLRIKQVNDPLLRFFHIKKNDLIGREIQFSPLGSYLNEERSSLLKKAIDGNPLSLEESITFEDKRYIFLIRIIPVLLSHGEKGVLLILEDITTLKHYQLNQEEIIADRTAELIEVNEKLRLEIEERKKLNSQIEISMNQYQQLADSSTDLILKFSAGGVLTYNNQLAGKMLGISFPSRKKYQMLGTCVPDTDQYQDYVNSLLSELITDTTIIRRADFEYRSPSPFWISWTFHSIISTLKGEPEILCIGTDITERMISEKQLQESEAYLTRILAHLPDPTFVINPDRKVILWNQAMEEMTGVPADQVIGKERSFFTPPIFGFARPVLADLIFEPENEAITRYFRDLSRDGEILTAETDGVGKDRKDRIFWVKVTPVKDEQNRIVAAIQSLRDITRIRRMEKVLSESECRIRGMLEASKDLVIVLDDQKNVIFANPAYYLITRTDDTTLKGNPVSEAVLPGDFNAWSQHIDYALRTGLSNRVEIPMQYEQREITLDCYLIPFYPHKSKDVHLLIDIRDITAIKRKGKPLWDDEETLQEIGKKVTDLFSNMSMHRLIFR